MKTDGLTFVDAHVHLWDAARLPYPWLAEVPAIAGRHTPTELAIEVGAGMPTEIVFVESAAASDRGRDEVRWVEELAEREPRIAAVVAQVAVDRGAETEASLAALADRALVRGVRHIIQDHPEPGYCLRPAFVAGVRRVGEQGWTFDLCVKHWQLPACIDLVRACPGTTFVLDHAGKPDIRRGLLEPWRAHIAELGLLPNVVCKLSGLVTEAEPATWTPAALRPCVDHLLSCFGAERLLFGSDWPVVKLAASYRRWLETALELLAPLSADERAKVFSQNARRTYRLMNVDLMTTPFRLDGKKALVTGAGSGIGKAIAELFAAQGASLLVVDRDEAAGVATVDAIRAASGRADFAVVDVADESAVLALARGLPPMDILVACAGIGHVGDLPSTTTADLDRLYAVNVRGVFNCCKAFAPAMIERGAGSVINMASIGGIVAVRQRLAYTTTKFAVVGLTKSLALDHSHSGVRFNCICPGRVETPFAMQRIAESPDPAQAYRDMAATQLTGRMAKPAEIAAAALYLAADESAMVTGSSLMIDGGWSAGK